jgi:hypothetical protein
MLDMSIHIHYGNFESHKQDKSLTGQGTSQLFSFLKKSVNMVLQLVARSCTSNLRRATNVNLNKSFHSSVTRSQQQQQKKKPLFGKSVTFLSILQVLMNV